jgi:hypothetical protein
MVAIDSDPGRCSRLLVMIEISTKYGLPTVLLYLNSNYGHLVTIPLVNYTKSTWLPALLPSI